VVVLDVEAGSTLDALAAVAFENGEAYLARDWLPSLDGFGIEGHRGVRALELAALATFAVPDQREQIVWL
jgi:hypothetical protein